MKRSILAAAVVAGLAHAAPAHAQFVVGTGWRGGFGYGHGGGLGFSYRGHHFRAAGFAGFGSPGFGLGGFGSGYYARSVFFAPMSPVFPPISQWTPFGFGPGFLEPGWGVGPQPGWNPVWGAWGPPPPVVGVPFALGGDDFNPDPNANPNAAAPPQRLAPEPGPAGAKPGDFVVFAPKKDFPPPGVVAPEVGRVARPEPKPPIRFDPFAKRVEINVEKPEADPALEAARLLKLGRAAFAAGEYGKAGEQFDRAAAVLPKAAEPRFLKAQAALAAGSYADAVLAIREGLALDPKWPASPFDPKEPYGANVAPFAEHLAALRKAAAANPGEPTLEFLIGYELWFVGEKAEAKKWFEAAAKTLPAPGPIALCK